jgi:hypothetical protein
MIAVAKVIAKKLIVALLSNPERAIKFILIALIVPILFIMTIFTIPASLFSSIPSALMSTSAEAEEITNNYLNAPDIVEEELRDWVDDKKQEYSYCNDIKTNFNVSLDWKALIAIHTVEYEQKLEKASNRVILKLGRKFIEKDVEVETYKVKKTYYKTVKDEEGNPVLDEEGNPKRVKKTKYVERKRAIISVSSISFYEMLDKINFTNEEKELAENFYKNISILDEEGNANIYDDVDLSDLKEYPAGSAKVVYYNQTDKRWGLESYGNSTILNAGCGPTSLAMVVASYKNSNITPKEVADWSVKNGHRAEGQGSYWSLMTDGGKHYGFDVETVSRRNPDRVIEALSNGYPIIVSMGRGHFTTGGHFLVLRGLTDDGKILVNDSASLNRTNEEWDIGIIMNESSTNGGSSGSPFFILKP